MDEKLIPELTGLGLSDKEARVYLANLSLGYSTVQKIAQRSNIKRVTTYVILDGLMQKGLVSQIQKEKKTFFVAEDPANLSRLLEKTEREIKDRKTHLESILPKLRQIHQLPPERPEVRFYTGKEGMKTISAETLREARRAGDEIYGMINLNKVFKVVTPEELAEHSGKRVRLGIKSKVFYSGKQPSVSPLRQQKLIADQYPINADISLLKDKLYMISYETEKPVGVVIEEPHIARTLRSLFELAWDALNEKKTTKK